MTTQLQPSQLILKNGTCFEGLSPSWQPSTIFGEAVFSTGMAGYPESLTDPSFTGQLLCFTYPLIGNYGIPHPDQWESKRIHAAGLIVDQLSPHHNHSQSVQSLDEWLETHQLPFITGIDTRALTRHLREAGTMPAAITTEGIPESFPNTLDEHLVSRCGPTESTTYPGNKKTLIAVDCGMKENIIRSLKKCGVTIRRVPFDYDYSEESFDGVFLSNGPGNPEKCLETVAVLKKAMEKKKPIFGICLGTQLLALAAGAKIYKLPYGHRGHNQPCMEISTQRCVITSQNHGFAVEEESLPSDWMPTYRNLNDQSLEGIAHRSLPFSAVQFHPEGCPGPTDTQNLFQAFCDQL